MQYKNFDHLKVESTVVVAEIWGRYSGESWVKWYIGASLDMGVRGSVWGGNAVG